MSNNLTRTGWLISAAMAAILGFLAGTANAEVAGSFRPTKQQWLNLQADPVRKMSFRTEIRTEGSIAYNDDAVTQVFSPYTGRVTRILVEPGAAVKKGQPLAAIAAGESVQAQSDLQAALAQQALAEANEKRQHALFLSRSGALKDWQQSRSDLAVATANLKAVRERLMILGKSASEIDAMEKGANLAANPDALVRSPISGTVIKRQIGPGQNVGSVASGSATALFTVGDLSKVWLVANVREVDAGKVEVGEPVEVKVLAFPDRIFRAKISWVAPAVDPSTRRLPVRAVMENPEGKLKAEMFASFSILVGKESESPGVPQSAIVYEGENARVYVVNPDGSISIRKVELGRTRHQDGMVEILSGLEGGEKIVTSGTLFIDRAITLGMNQKP